MSADQLSFDHTQRAERVLDTLDSWEGGGKQATGIVIKTACHPPAGLVSEWDVTCTFC